MTVIRIVKHPGHTWPGSDSRTLTFPLSELRRRVVARQLDLLGETEGGEHLIPSELLYDEYVRLRDGDETTQADWDSWDERLHEYARTLDTERLMDWLIRLSDPATIAEWSIEAE